MKNKAINIFGVLLVTFSLFLFEASEPKFFILELLWSFGVSIILWLGNSIAVLLLNRYIPWRNQAISRVFIQAGVSIIFTIWLTFFAVKYLYIGIYELHFSTLVFRKHLFVFLTISLLYNAVYSGSHFFKKWRLSIVEAEALKRENIISQYTTLKNQINPHFLFNSINTMIGLIDEDPELAKEYGHHFAEIYRHILVKGKEELVTLEEELEIVAIQRKLFHSRFGEGLIFNQKIPVEIMGKKLPPLTLQMLVENAIKHNTISIKQPLFIEITSENGKNLSISNNIQRKNLTAKSTNIGIENIKMRYRLITDKGVSIEENQSTFTVSLPLLMHKEK